MQFRPIILTVLAVASVFPMVSGLTALNTIDGENNQLENEIEKIVVDIEAEKALTNDITTPLMKLFDSDVIDPIFVDEGIQIFISEGSTTGDYCIAGRTSYNTDGIYVSTGNSDPQPVIDDPCNGSTMNLFQGEEEIENLNGTEPLAVGAIRTGMVSSVVWLGVGVLGRKRRKEGGDTLEDETLHIVTSLEPAEDKDKAISAPAEEPREALHEKMNTIIRQWSEYELDPVKILDYPMISNMGFAPTSAFHLAMLRAKNGFNSNEDIAVLKTLVTELEHTYTVMVSEAKRMKWNQFSAEEQKHLRSAQNLLNIALNSSSSPNERNIAYKRLLKEVEGIITLSPATILAIEERSMLGIEA